MPIESLIREIQPFSRGHYLKFWNNWFSAKLGTNPISAALGAFRTEAHAPCRATQGLSSDLQMMPIESLITGIQPFSRGHYLKFWNNWFSAKLWTNRFSAALGVFWIESHASSKATQGLSIDLQITPVESFITEIQPFFRGHYLHFWNNFFCAKLGSNIISAALDIFRIKAHASSKVTQGLSNDLQMMPIQSLITEIQPFFQGHYLHFWNNWFFTKLGTNLISAELSELRTEAHASCRATQGLSNDLQMTPIESLITEIQLFSWGHYLKFWNNWFSAKLWTNPISAVLGVFRIEAHASHRTS